MKNGKYIDEYGTERWYRYNVEHRLDGPASICKNGSKFWYYYGVYHRVDGPSDEYSDGRKYWFYYGYNCKKEEDYWDIDKRREIKYEYYMRMVKI